ncbi:MAG: hypothetical protein AAB262_15440 [Elusimicrobiota bacterium]
MLLLVLGLTLVGPGRAAGFPAVDVDATMRDIVRDARSLRRDALRLDGPVYLTPSIDSRRPDERTLADFFERTVESLLNDESDRKGKSLSQRELNDLVRRFSLARMRPADLEGLVFRLGSDRRVPIERQADAIRVYRMIAEVKTSMDHYHVDDVVCSFVVQDDMHAAVAKDSPLKNPDSVPEDSRVDMRLDREDLLVVGKCRGWGLLTLPEFGGRR